MKDLDVLSSEKNETSVIDTDNGVHPETSFQLKSLGRLLQDSGVSEKLAGKKNWWSKKSNPSKSPRDFGIDDTIGSFITWNKGSKNNGKTKNYRKMKTTMAKKEQKEELKKGREMESRVVTKLPQILQKQKQLEEFDKAEKIRIAKQDEALLEIDKLLAKLEREEPKTKKTHTPKQSTQQFRSKDDMWGWDDERPEKPITYHDSLTDSLDRLLEDIEEQMGESF